MRRSSSTSRSEFALRLLGACVAILVDAGAAAARPWPCLPPLFDGGQRMHAMPAPSFFSLELLLRQHEICWREPASPGELRVALIGNSVAYGMPLAVEETFAARLNQHFAARGIAARVFNLAFVYAFQVRDAFVIHEALRYQPDVIVYALSLSEFIHFNPYRMPYFARFFDSNHGIAEEFLADPPAGLSDPFDRYREFFTRQGNLGWLGVGLREAGAFLRAAIRASAEAIADRLHAPRTSPASPPLQRWTTYDCARILAMNAEDLRDWKQWNVLAYLEQIQRTRGVEVLVVGMPVARAPVGDCYNVRYGNAILADFMAWTASETRARGLHYLDLYDQMPASAFLDSAHLAVEGQQRVADAIARRLDPILAERAR